MESSYTTEKRRAGALNALLNNYCPKCKRTVRCNPGAFKSHLKWCQFDPMPAFWAKVDKSAASGCWNWTGYKDKWGYGDLRMNRKHVQSHRLAWRVLRGEPGKLDVLHKCHNPSCCNPDHLYLGTDADNTRDRVAAGRHTWGERNSSAILTVADVLEIRRNPPKPRARGAVKALAAKYGVSPLAINAVLSRRSWKLV